MRCRGQRQRRRIRPRYHSNLSEAHSLQGEFFTQVLLTACQASFPFKVRLTAYTHDEFLIRSYDQMVRRLACRSNLNLVIVVSHDRSKNNYFSWLRQTKPVKQFALKPWGFAWTFLLHKTHHTVLLVYKVDVITRGNYPRYYLLHP